MYLERQRIEREQKWDHGDYDSWLPSWLYKLLANYGVQPYRLIVFSVVLIGLGTILFGLPATVAPKIEKPASEPAAPIKLSHWDAFAVSLRQFLPVDVPMGSQWVPSDKPVDVSIRLFKWKPAFRIRPSAFATFFLRLAGWILVPLGVAALTGLLRVAP